MSPTNQRPGIKKKAGKGLSAGRERAQQEGFIVRPREAAPTAEPEQPTPQPQPQKETQRPARPAAKTPRTPVPKPASEAAGEGESSKPRTPPRMTLHLAPEVPDELHELIYDELEVTGRMPTLWAAYDRALAEFMPSLEEAQTQGEPVPETVKVYTNIAAQTRRPLAALVRRGRTNDGEKIPAAWWYSTAVRRFIAARRAELELS